jgi:UPF0716 protein FxsA
LDVLPLIFVGVPIAELLVLAVVERRIGLGPTLLLILFTGLLGAYLLRRQGFATLAAIRAEMVAGGFPGRSLAHGGLILFGGGLLLTPGFITDAVGFALMIPAVRELARKQITHFVRGRTVVRW